MRILSTIILAITILPLHAQNKDSLPEADVKFREFKNQGEWEDYSAEKFFEKNYKKQTYERYKGIIIVEGDLFTFSGQSFEVIDTSKELRAIFSKGLFYPSVITGQINAGTKTIGQPDILSLEQRIMNISSRINSCTISSLEEMTFLRKSPTQRRFRFWLFRKGIANPVVCFFELTNNNATDKTDMGTFINGAELTWYAQGWIII